ncbi:MAG: TetR/AcrR family transcriptional regulator, partial [Bifidobacteriaceae bacterium]|nr:TetR/AcrR family transcriptional regulator [Bifidobacteriaceae bacterium]
MRESRKTRYTRLALRGALVEALAEKPLNKITVTELCERADLSRGTFYLHYANPAELLEHFEDDLFEALSAPLRQQDQGGNREFLLGVLRELASQPQIAKLVLRPGSTLVERFFAFKRERTERECRERFPHLGERQLEYVRTFKEQGSVHLIGEWIAGGMVEPPEEIAALLEELV